MSGHDDGDIQGIVSRHSCVSVRPLIGLASNISPVLESSLSSFDGRWWVEAAVFRVGRIDYITDGPWSLRSR